MCSIIGYLGSSISAQDLRAGFDKTISRGPDDTRMLHIGAATLGFPAHSAAFELNLTALFATLTGKPVQAKPISTFPPVKQDLAFTVDETVTAGQLENVIRKAAGANLESIELFDVFTGEQVGEGKKSLAYAVVFRSPSKTLSAEDSDAIRKAIVAEAAEIGAQLRA